ERNSSGSRAFMGLSTVGVRAKKLPHRSGNFDDVCFGRKMSSIQKLDLRFRDVFPKCFRARRNKKRIVLTPDRKQWWLRFAEIFLKLWIELYVGRIIQKQIQLNLLIPWP